MTADNEIENDIEYLMEDYGIDSCTLNVFALAGCMGLKVKSYDEYGPASARCFRCVTDDGFSFLCSRENQFYVVYNDCRTLSCIEFTMAHEIGHIRLGHKESTPQNEAEADTYATCLLSNVLLPVNRNDYALTCAGTFQNH